MLDYKNLIKDVKKTIRSHSAEELQEWIDSYYQRIALAEQEDDLYQPAAMPQTVNGKLRSEGVPVKKSIAVKPVRTSKVRAKAMATADVW